MSHCLAQNGKGVWVCERETVQACMGVCVCVNAGMRVCLEGSPSQSVNLGHTGGKQEAGTPGQRASGLRLKPLHRNRSELRTEQQRQMFQSVMIYIRF